MTRRYSFRCTTRCGIDACLSAARPPSPSPEPVSKIRAAIKAAGGARNSYNVISKAYKRACNAGLSRSDAIVGAKSAAIARGNRPDYKEILLSLTRIRRRHRGVPGMDRSPRGPVRAPTHTTAVPSPGPLISPPNAAAAAAVRYPVSPATRSAHTGRNPP